MSLSKSKKEAALAEYCDECQDILERLAKSLLKLEKDGASSDLIGAIYRDIHTLKGSSQLFGFAQIGNLAHAMETSLDPVRKGLIGITSELLDIIYIGNDLIAKLLSGIRENKVEADLGEVVEVTIARLVEAVEIANEKTSVVFKDSLILAEDVNLEAKLTLPVEVEKSPDNTKGLHLFADEDSASDSKESTESKEKPSSPLPENKKDLSNIESKTQTNIESKTQTNIESKTQSEVAQIETIRVQVSLLDNIMNLIGELVLIRNQLLQHARANENDNNFANMSQRLNVLTGELQNEVMKTRMQPVGNVLNKFTRVVRDLAKELSKKITIEIQGAETELDKTILEAIKDPLTHVVRNSVDHGIEGQEERKKRGKSETGRIVAKAYHESGQVIIEVSDDGKGLDRAIIGAKAIEKGLVTKALLEKMSDKEVQLLIFAPGFSTAEKVSNISGRGVGMDVVKTNVEKIGGVVDISSVPGLGTTMRIKIPLTLAIVPALIVKCGRHRFAIPQTKLVELIRIDNEDPQSEKIEFLQGAAVYRLRGQLLSIISLDNILQIEEKQNANSSTNVVVLNADGKQFGLVVDEIVDSADIVVKNLVQFLKEVNIFSGATIMGDGSIALVLDVAGLSAIANLSIDHSEHGFDIKNNKQSSSGHRSEACEYLLIDIKAPGNYVIPLTIVSRIEEFEKSRFEFSGEQRVVRYRNNLLPIFSLAEFLHLPFVQELHENKDRIPVVVVKRGDRLYGVEVAQIQDIIVINSEIDQRVKDRPGILGTIVTQSEILVVADVFALLDFAKTKLEYENNGKNQLKDEELKNIRSSFRILVVDDSSFFRNYIKKILLDAGYQVNLACDGGDGFSQLEDASKGYFSLVVSDVEMPVLDGFALASKIRSSEILANLPIVAVTTKYSANDAQSGLASGFNKYLEKLNVENFLCEVDDILLKKNEVKRESSKF